MHPIEEHNKFWDSFCRDPLYNCGFADFVQSCGANKVETIQDALMAMSYLKGAADACRLANEYMSSRWQIANLIGIATVTFRVTWEEIQEKNFYFADFCYENYCQRFNALDKQYTRELTALVEKI